jgi:hypothetical protein
MTEVELDVYEGVFKKQDGSLRKMKFVKLAEMPKLFLESKLTGKKTYPLQDGLERVWDLESQEIRIFNWKTVLGEVKKETKKFVL